MRGAALFFILFASVSLAGDIGQIGGGGVHNGTAGLQGGTTDEYYHATAAEYTVLQNTSGTNTGDVTTSAGLAAALSDETGTGSCVFNDNPIFDQVIGIGSTSLYNWPVGWNIVQMGADDNLALFSNGADYIGLAGNIYTLDGVNWKCAKTGYPSMLWDLNLAGGGYGVLHVGPACTAGNTVPSSDWESSSWYFDPKGRMGVDVTPDVDWSTIFSPIGFGKNSYLAGTYAPGAGSSTFLINNGFYNGSLAYEAINTDEASQLMLYSGSILGRVSDVVTAGNTITFTDVFEGKKDGWFYVYNQLVVGKGAAGVDYVIAVDGENNDGYFIFYEDENRWVSTNNFGLANGSNFVLGTTTGSKVGSTSSEKLSFWGATPVVQPSSSGSTAGVTFGTGTSLNDDSCSTGGVGSTCYTLSDVVAHLKTTGVLAQ